MPKIIKLSGEQREAVSVFERSTLVPEQIHNGQLAAQDAAAIIARAHEEAEAIAREAHAEGMRQGIAEGERKFRASVSESAGVLKSAAIRVEQSHKDFLEEIEPQVIRLAASIASKILERESSLSPEMIQRTVHSALEKVIDEEHVVIRVNPKDLDTLRQYRAELMQEFDGIKRIDLVPDDQIDAGGCVAQTDSVRIDGRLASQLEKILNELLG